MKTSPLLLMPTKKPRRTFDRILDVSLAMFNRFGEHNVSTSQLCGELGISPGNLFYHHPTKNALVHGLLARYQLALADVLANAPPPHPWPEASPALQALAALCEGMAHVAWSYRFLFRDLPDLVSRHRQLEAQVPPLLQQQAAALSHSMYQLDWQAPAPSELTLQLWVGPMLATLTGCMGLDGAMDPRERLRAHEDPVCDRAVGRALGMILHALPRLDQAALSKRLTETPELGQDPWWLASPQG